MAGYRPSSTGIQGGQARRKVVVMALGVIAWHRLAPLEPDMRPGDPRRLRASRSDREREPRADARRRVPGMAGRTRRGNALLLMAGDNATSEELAAAVEPISWRVARSTAMCPDRDRYRLLRRRDRDAARRPAASNHGWRVRPQRGSLARHRRDAERRHARAVPRRRGRGDSAPPSTCGST